MKSIWRGIAGVLLLALLAASASLSGEEAKAPGPIEALKIATEAYIYGYPLVTFDMARRQQTNVAQPDAEHAPMGQMIRMRELPGGRQPLLRRAQRRHAVHRGLARCVRRSRGVFSIPDMGNRYYIMPMLDGWSEVILRRRLGAPPAARRRPTRSPARAGRARLPAGVTQVKSPTGMVWILGRIYSTGTPEDYEAVHALQDQFSVVPLVAWGKPYTPPAGVVDPSFDMKTAVRKQVNALDVEAYFTRLAQLMKTNPPTAAGRADGRARWRRSASFPGRTSTRASSACSTARRSRPCQSSRCSRWACT